MRSKLYVLVFLSNLGLFLCAKIPPPDINLISNANTNKDDKSFKFLHKIQDDLRRNNDDYAEAKAKVDIKVPLPNDNLKFHYVKGSGNHIKDDGIRRAYEESFSDEDLNSTDYRIFETPQTTTAKRFSKVTQTTTQKPIETSKISKENLNKLKLFFEKNEALQKASGKFKITTKAMGHIKMKARGSNEEIKVPNSEQLDMAPARGGRIHLLRIKGRMCQRNVLIPEGPKYDSKGQVYLPAFRPGPRNRNFEKTTPHRIILPRCCNCCQKSVLGCE